MTVEVVIAHTDTHARLLQAVLTEGYSPQNTFLSKRSVAIVHEQQAGRGIGCKVDVLPSIFVKISGNRGKAIGRRGFTNPCMLSDVREGPVPVIPVQGVLARTQPARSTLHRNAFPPAVRVGARNASIFEGETHVIGDEQIEIPIAIVIDEGAAGPEPVGLAQKSSLPGYIRKS